MSKVQQQLGIPRRCIELALLAGDCSPLTSCTESFAAGPRDTPYEKGLFVVDIVLGEACRRLTRSCEPMLLVDCVVTLLLSYMQRTSILLCPQRCASNHKCGRDWALHDCFAQD